MELKVIARVRAARPWVQHAKRAKAYPIKSIPGGRSANKPVVLGIGAPRDPESVWDCGTDLVWPVLELNGIPLEPQNGLMPYVCRHQIVAGD